MVSSESYRDQNQGQKNSQELHIESRAKVDLAIVGFDVCGRTVTSLYFLVYHFPDGWVFVLVYFCSLLVLFLVFQLSYFFSSIVS